jgi:hypothetical protein
LSRWRPTCSAMRPGTSQWISFSAMRIAFS